MLMPDMGAPSFAAVMQWAQANAMQAGTSWLLLEWMKHYGSSVVLTWAEDDGWECAWITGGMRYVGRSTTASDAIRQACQTGLEAVHRGRLLDGIA